jgi:4-carboxymuconolactone decarboxylase
MLSAARNAADETIEPEAGLMDKERFETGMARRKSTLGAEYVDKSMAAADDFNRPFQEMMTEWAWGFGWGDEVIVPRTRSMMNLTMIAALGRMHEWELHFNGAIDNGVSKEELRAIIHVIAIYCGVPAGVECFRIARKVFAERDTA